MRIQCALARTHVDHYLVLCFDGTGNGFDVDNSNVLTFHSMLCKDYSDVQKVYYQTGIGTYTTTAIKTPLLSKVSETVDMMVATTMDDHIKAGYEWLMQTCK